MKLGLAVDISPKVLSEQFTSWDKISQAASADSVLLSTWEVKNTLKIWDHIFVLESHYITACKISNVFYDWWFFIKHMSLPWNWHIEGDWSVSWWFAWWGLGVWPSSKSWQVGWAQTQSTSRAQACGMLRSSPCTPVRQMPDPAKAGTGTSAAGSPEAGSPSLLCSPSRSSPDLAAVPQNPLYKAFCRFLGNQDLGLLHPPVDLLFSALFSF